MRRSLERMPISTAPIGRVTRAPTTVIAAMASTLTATSCAASESCAPKAPMRGTPVSPLKPPVTSRHCSASCSSVSDSTSVSRPTTTAEGRRRSIATPRAAATPAPTPADTTSIGTLADGAAVGDLRRRVCSDAEGQQLAQREYARVAPHEIEADGEGGEHQEQRELPRAVAAERAAEHCSRKCAGGTDGEGTPHAVAPSTGTRRSSSISTARVSEAICAQTAS